MSYYGWKPYVPVAKRRADAEKAAAKAKKAGKDHSPIAPYRGAIAKTFWGKAWCDNLEFYSDYANRLPRGRTYVRNGSVIDLKIASGTVRAQVMGSSVYQVEVTVKAVADKNWRAIGADCSGSIDSLIELLQGKLSKAVMERICKPGVGLFPSPNEIEFNCSCPDWASMCKHVAAVLYGIGARLDQQPELLFGLRHVDAKDLVAQAETGLQKSGRRPQADKLLDEASLADVFGIEMAEAPPPRKPVAARVDPKKASTAKPTAKPVAKTKISTTRKSPANARKAPGGKNTTSKPAAAPVTAKSPARKSTPDKLAARKDAKRPVARVSQATPATRAKRRTTTK